jgi:glycosyltransferase involved in cell wall biosynthesis
MTIDPSVPTAARTDPRVDGAGIGPPGDGPVVLYITNGFPFPLTSGYLRHYFLIGELARAGHRVILLSVVGADHRPEHADAMADRTVRVETFTSLDRARRSHQRWLRRLRRVLPVGGGDPAGHRLGARVAEIVASERIDAVVFSGRRTDRALAALGPTLPIVIDMCDATSLRLEREAAVAGARRRLALAVQRAQVRRTEARMLRRADRLLFASLRDLEALVPGGPDPRTAIVPNGVDADYWSRTAATLGQGIIFTGAMSYAPNVDAAVRLARDILPRVRRAVPDAAVTIVGRDPSPAVTDLAALPGVVVTGSVADMRPWLEAAAVFAAPLRFGAGIQNKLLEAMAMGLPSVVSTVAADGLRTADGDTPPIVVEDDDAAAAAAVVRLLAAVGGDPTPDAAARAFVTRHFDWGRSGAVLREQIERARAGQRAE